MKGNAERKENRWKKIQYQAPSVNFIASIEEGTEDRCDWTPYLYFKQFVTDETGDQTNLYSVQKKGRLVNTTVKQNRF